MKYVFALGGNAFDKKKLDIVSKALSSLYRKGHQIVITHGNGPQVGELYLEEGKNLAILTAQTEAEIGVILQEKISARIGKESPIVLTRVLVDRRDPEFRRPTKPIGKFYADRSLVPKGGRQFKVKKLSKGYRLVVPSPKPIDILEINEIKQLLLKDRLVIAGGGGGIAVVKVGDEYEFADAVLDKDLTSSLLAVRLKADRLFILTDVAGTYLNFGTKRSRLIKKMHVKEADAYMKKGSFEEGSMKPKVQACINFVRATGKIGAIGNISKISEVISLKSTVVLP